MQCNRKKPIHIFFMLLLQCIGTITAFAANDPIQTFPLLGSKDSVKVNYVSTVTDFQNLLRIQNPNLLPQIEPNTTHITNIVSVGIEEENKNYIQSDFSVSLVLHIKKYDQSLTLSDEFDSTFTINYKKAEGEKYNASQYLSFENAYKVEVKIVSITPDTTSWDVAKVLRVDNILQVSRDYVFDCSKVIPGLNVNLDNVNGELTASWNDPGNGQTEYDLEWAWIDESAIADYQQSGQFLEDKLFINNTTRVTVDSLHYNIPLLYDGDGRLFVRVRPAQIKTTGQRVEGEWTWLNDQSHQPVFYTYSGHQNNLNWQASTSYAEGGKRKSVVQYFDGTLRNRQTVTKDNTTGTTVVSESYYDYQGRPVIQVLPSPTLNTIIEYSENFNKAVNYTGYPKWAYDKLSNGATQCGNPAAPLSTTNGAAKYYSPDNELNTAGTDYNPNKYIPNSEGPVTGEAYPFTETRFNGDGRVGSQGGVGYAFQLGSGHETKYYYESPAQEELDALFGTDAGLASHYFKNIVKDANGQYSVSYTDMHGRTVATALAGDVPKNASEHTLVEPLSSLNTQTFTRQLIDDETNRINGTSIVSSKSLIVPKQGLYTFDYTFDPDQLKLVTCDSQQICFDCLYNLKITITADCNGVEGFPYTVVDSNFTIGGLLTSPVCNDSGKATTFFNKHIPITLPEGAYTVTKTLSLSDSAQNIYRDVFLNLDSCKKIEDFYNETYQVLQSQSNCVITCSACDSAIGHDLAGFRQNFIDQTGVQLPLTDSMEAAISAAYDEARANCDRICNTFDDDGMENIRNIRKIMLLDVSPAGGQYANPDSTSAMYSIFNSANANLVFTQQYKNELGQTETPVFNGNPSAQLFSDQFKSSWAEQLLPLHPEYCRLQTIEQQLPATYHFEADLNHMNTWADMLAATTPGGDYISNLVSHDPFFSNIGGSAPGYAYRDSIIEALSHYSSNGQGGYFTLWQIAQSTVLCRNEDTTGGIGSAQSVCVLNTQPEPPVNLSACEEDRNLVWTTYRSIYLTLRSNYISKYLNAQCNTVTNASLFAQGKTPRFFDSDDNTSMSGTDAGNLNDFFNQINNGDNAATGTGSALLKEQYDSTCIGYANTWIQQLSECDILSQRWQDQGLKTSDSIWIVDRLRDVCVNGSDQDHYFGSSSINPDSLSATQFGYSDFPSVIDSFFQTHGLTLPVNSTCNPYLITVPKPYGQQAPLTNTVIITKPSDCECTQISALSTEYQNSGYSGNFSSYLEDRYQTVISQGALDTLLHLCDGTYECVFLPAPITLPAVLQCQGSGSQSGSLSNACINCMQYQAIKDSFELLYNHPALIVAPQSDSDLNWNLAFQSFANYKTGFSKTWEDYLAFADSCENYLPSDCEVMQNLVKNFKTSSKHGRVTHILQTQENHNITDLSKLIVNGAIQFPDSVRQLPNTWYNNYLFNTNNGDKICDAEGYAIEIRFKFYDNHYGDVFYSGLGVGFTGRRYPTGLILNANGQDYTIDPNPNAILNWMTFKAVITPSMQYVYYNGNLVFQVTRDPSVPISSITGFTMGLFGRQGCVDWVKIYDHADNLKYFEDFNDANNTAFIDPSIICPAPPDCQTAFTTYYNQQRGTNYTFSQLDSINMESCGKHLEVCGNLDTLVVPDSGVPKPSEISCEKLISTYNNFLADYPDPSNGAVVKVFVPGESQELNNSVFENNLNTLIDTMPALPDSIQQSEIIMQKLQASKQSVSMQAMSLSALTTGEYVDSLLQCKELFEWYFNNALGTSGYTYENFADWLVNGCGYKIHQLPCSDIVYVPCDTLELIKSLFDAKYPDSLGETITDSLRIPINKVTHLMQRFTYSGAFYDEVSFSSGAGIDAFTWTNYTGGFWWQNVRDNITFDFRALPANAVINNASLNLYAKPEQVEFYTCCGAHYRQVTDSVYGIFEKLTAPVIPGVTVWSTLPETDTTDRLLIDSISVSNGQGVATDLFSDEDYLGQQCTQLVRTLHSDAWQNKNYGLLFRQSEENLGTYKAYNFWGITAQTPQGKQPYLSVNYTSNRCDLFTAFVNEKLGTHLTSAEVQNLFLEKCNVTATPCGTVQAPFTGDNGPHLCGLNQPVFQTLDHISTPCKDLDRIAYNTAIDKWQLYIDSVRNVFDTAYYNKCMSAKNLESFTVTYQTSEYHYTLYYYDQAGNLVATVPPAGVDDKHGNAGFLDSVKIARADELANGPSAANSVVPQHTLVTRYRYNTLNQVIAQFSPDAKESKFWYDVLGRIVVSQNAQQAHDNKYSYTEYDKLGRKTQVGQKPQTTTMTEIISRSPATLNNWLTASQNKEQITRTVYDVSYYSGDSIIGPYLHQRNLRNRVSYMQVFDNEPSGTGSEKWLGTHASATYYSYDIHGNVDTLLQDYRSGAMADAGNRYKKIVYDYDLISGKVNSVAYQPGQADAFYHRYSYDAENRLTDVETSSDKLIWEHDARYYYYKHGPLERTILGQNQVQGIDYANTLQGWLKGINSTSVGDGTFDIGQDGKVGSMNSNIARDAYGFALHYFQNDAQQRSDYVAIGNNLKPFANPGISGAAPYAELFNSNVGAMSVNIPKIGDALLTIYRYDQLNRLIKTYTYKGLNASTNSWSKTAIQDYREEFSYSPDGSILSLKRNGSGSTVIDNASWNYYSGTHQLEHINDPAGRHGFDAGMQANNNYTYDSIGEMTSDAERGLTNISWNVYGKVAQQQLSAGRTINYTYDAAANRISKQVTGTGTYTEWYVRDASGNLLSIYRKTDSLRQTELYKYGAKMLGLKHDEINMETVHPVGNIITLTAGNDEYYLTDHRGNNMVSVMDTRTQHDDNGDGIVDYYTANIATAQDYSSFGALLDGRRFGTTPRFTYNGKQLDKETGWQDYGMREYLGGEVPVFASVDPLIKSYPYYSPYQFAGNKPIVAIDLDGLEELLSIIRLRAEAAKLGVIGNKRVGELFERVAVAALSGRSVTTFSNTNINFPSAAREDRNGPSGPTAVRPDLVGFTFDISLSPATTDVRYGANQFFEVKATYATITRAFRKGQIEGMIDVLSEQAKLNKNKAAELVLVGTSDLKIGGDIFEYAKKKGVTISAIIAGVDEKGEIYFSDLTELQPGKGRSNVIGFVKDLFKRIFGGGTFAGKPGFKLSDFINGISNKEKGTDPKKDNVPSPISGSNDPDPIEINDK